MKTKYFWISSLCFLTFLPAPSFAQCKNQQDKHCWNLQYILYAAQTDFRGLQPTKPLRHGDPVPKLPNPDVSVAADKVPCRLSSWASNVSVYMCNGIIPQADVEAWYAKTMTDLHELQYQWQFNVRTTGTDHYVDAGPRGCDAPPVDTNSPDGPAPDAPYITEGPYFGQCPLHLQAVRQPESTAQIYFWVTSYTSAYLARRPPDYAPKGLSAKAPSSALDSAAEGDAKKASQPMSHFECDEMCQSLKKILEGRASAFRELSTGSTDNASPSQTTASESTPSSVDTNVKLDGASSCAINVVPATPTVSSESLTSSGPKMLPVSTKAAPHHNSVGAPRPVQYVCYWASDSSSAAESQFRGLVSLMQFLIPSNWTVHQADEADDLSGARVSGWAALDPTNRPAVRIFRSGESLGLHVFAAQ